MDDIKKRSEWAITCLKPKFHKKLDSKDELDPR